MLSHFPKIVNGTTLDLAALQEFQTNAVRAVDSLENSFGAVNFKLEELQRFLLEANNAMRWLTEHHPDAMREYHATQLALHTLEEPPTPAP